MPLFEYSCDECSKRFTFLSGVVAENTEPRCPRCHSIKLHKLMSRVSYGRSDDERMDTIAEKMDAQDFDDTHSLRQLTRQLAREISTESGEDMTDALEQFIADEANANPNNSSANKDNKIY